MRAFWLMLRMSVAAAPALAAASFLVSLAIAVAGPLLTYGVKLYLDALAAGAAAPLALVLIGACALLVVAGSVVTQSLSVTLNETLLMRLNAEVLRIVSGTPTVAAHADAELSDKISLLAKENFRYLGEGLSALFGVVTTLVTSVTVLILLAGVHPLLLALPVLGLTRVWASNRAGVWLATAVQETSATNRLNMKMSDIAESSQHAVELRSFGLRNLLLDAVPQLYRLQNGPRWAAARRGGLLGIAVRVFYGVAYCLAVVFVIGLARAGQATPGDVVLLVLLAPQLEQMTNGLARGAQVLTQATKLFGNLDDLRQYAARQVTGTATPPDRLASGIRLRGVGFTYPGAEQPSLTEIDLDLAAGSTIALVGENGSGKSTLVSLLAGLYPVTDGEITVDGAPLADLDPVQWSRRISASMQDFVSYEFLARETVGVGDLPHLADPGAVTRAVRDSNADSVIAGLPDGLDSQLGTRFSRGVNLSGGQWQKLAIARAFMRKAPLLLLLDEPAAALDPEAEAALFAQYASAAKDTAANLGAITVLVSHRFSTVRTADVIVVLDRGRIAEIGDHATLIAAGGRYAELFELQASAYR